MHAKIILILSCLLLVSCSSGDALQRYSLPIKLRLETNEQLNWANNTANPVAVRIYQLAKKERFLQSNFITLFNGDTQVLSEQLIEKKRLYPVMPNTSEDITVKLLPGVRYLAVLVEFTQYQAGATKAVIELPEDVSEETVVWLGINGTGVKFNEIPEKSLLDNLFSWGA
ncbi:type VI secretion system lipoprotein TssJ [Pseudoalteromonas sp. MMG013]|uniref:Type VI secretion system protein VasD n=1 Tax=Pseudoalteromonas aurantia 208 TaxID=1314867 RepID=A0ABR9EHD7_9GAMM|nr:MULTISPECIES: type VI secretion system lipoprotein TssJ [Pseudoalteromonas]MBE0369635.1 type VI secretion system protein VasD [Pseudoalteromonas aurantia 208]MBQ4844172.1 type VI secretion system lipoprotein TssJ [Pseudoalteromonas sp. MMG005]MBQ4861253.1 type VI secretion system lipoprotein TssJ [Pseudoalteromonas sp. MMG013]